MGYSKGKSSPIKPDTDTASDCDGGSTDDERTPTASKRHEAS